MNACILKTSNPREYNNIVSKLKKTKQWNIQDLSQLTIGDKEIFKQEIKTLSEDSGVEITDTNINYYYDKVVRKTSNFLKGSSELFNKSLEDLYKNKGYALKFLENQVISSIFDACFFNRETGKIPSDTTSINSALRTVQQNLFDQIKEFLNKVGRDTSHISRLYGVRVNFINYQTVLDLAEQYINSENIIENLPDKLNETVKFYNNIMFLTHFDDLIDMYFSKIIQTQGSLKDLLSKENKYTVDLVQQDMSTYGFEDSKRSSSEELQTNIYKIFAQTIPYLSDEGKETGLFCSANHITAAFQLLKQNLLNLIYENEVDDNGNTVQFKYLDLNDNPIEAFKKLYNIKSIRENIIEKNNILKSVFHYLLNAKNGYITILNKLKQKDSNYVPPISLVNILGFEYAKSENSELLIYEESSQKVLNLNGLQQNQIQLEELRQYVYNKSQNRNQFTIEINGERISLLTESGIETFINTPWYYTYNGITRATEIYVGNNRLQTTIYKYLIDLLNTNISKLFPDIKNNKKLNSSQQNYLQSLLSNFMNGSRYSYLHPNFVLTEEYKRLNDNQDLSMVIPKMTTQDSEEKQIPLFRLPSAIVKDTYFISEYYKNFYQDLEEQDELDNMNIFADPEFSLFSSIGNPKYTTSTSIKVDAKIGETIKKAKDFTVEDNFYVDFMYGFLEGLESNIFRNQLVAYSDKSTIYCKNQNLVRYIAKQKESGQSFSTFTFNQYFNRQKAHYTALKKNLIKTWKAVLNNDSINSLEQINNALKEIKLDNELQEKIYNAYKNNVNLEVVEELHYSKYSDVNGGSYFELNKTLCRDIEDFTDLGKFSQKMSILYERLKTFVEESGIKNQLIKESSRYLKDENKSAEDFFEQKLKEYFLLKNFFTDQYLNISNSLPYIHPAKKVKYYKNPQTEEEIEFNRQMFNTEKTSRFTGFGKRQNSFTATLSPYCTNIDEGIPSTLRMAFINDPRVEVSNFDGIISKDLEAPNGSIFVPGFIGTLMENSLPGTGQKGTQKNFFVHVGKGYSTQIKDAQFLMTNRVILNSLTLDRKKNKTSIDFNEMLKKMCGEDQVNIDFYFKKFDNFYYPFNDGKVYLIRSIQIINNTLTIEQIEVDNHGTPLENAQTIQIEHNISTVYDLWQTLGGAYSMSSNNGELVWSESSMNTVADIIKGNNVLKKMISILGFKTAGKCGVVNLNPTDSLYDDQKLIHFKVKTQLSGIQNDKNESVDENEIKEITQLLAALAQGDYDGFAEEIYQDIAQSVTEALKEFNYKLNKNNYVPENLITQNDIEDITKKLFEKGMRGAENISLAKSILDLLKEKNYNIPYSNPNIYAKFINTLIGYLNKSVIRKTSSGLHGILSPSEGMFEFLEDENGYTYSMSSIAYLAIKDTSILGLTMKEKIDNYIAKYFPDIQATLENIDMEDTVKIEGQFIYIKSPKILNQVLTSIKQGIPCLKIQSAKKNLRPHRCKWKNETGEVFNLWTTPFTIAAFNAENANPNILEGLQQAINSHKVNKLNNINNSLKELFKGVDLSKDYLILSNISKQIDDLYKNLNFSEIRKILIENKFAILNEKGTNIQGLLNSIIESIDDLNNNIKESDLLSKATQLQMILLDYNKSLNFEQFTKNHYYALFNYLITIHTSQIPYRIDQIIDILERVDIQGNVISATIPIYDKVFHKGEMILPQLHKEKLNIGDTPISVVYKLGADFFKQKLSINSSPLQNSIATITTDIGQFGLLYASDTNIKNWGLVDVTKKLKTQRQGNKVFVVDNHNDILYQLEEGLSILLDPKSNKYYINVKGTKNDKQGVYTINPTIHSFIKSFKNIIDIQFNETNAKKSIGINTIAYILNENLNTNYLTKDFKNLLQNMSNINNINLNELILEYNQKSSERKNKNIKEISEYKYQAFLALQEIISARIPGQNRASFMSCKNIEYSGSDLNNVYANRYLMWIQGGDYDIDVANIMNYDLNKLGRLHTYNNFSNEDESITDLNSLDFIQPKSSNLITLIDGLYEGNNQTVLEILSILTNTNMSKYTKVDLILKLINKSENALILPYHPLLKEINNYNSQNKNPKVTRNKILRNIIKSADKLSNLQSSYRSVDVVTQIIKDATKNQKISIEFNGDIRDCFSIYYIQVLNHDGKNTVGIFANAIKATFTLLHHYNKTHEKLNTIIKIPFEDGTYKSYNISEFADSFDFKGSSISYNVDDIMSAFMSLSVDNAKELMLSVLNAGQTFAGTYAYALMLGIPVESAIEFFTRPEVKAITKGVNQFLFEKSDDGEQIINETDVKNYIINKLNDQTISTYERETLSTLLQMFQGAQELRKLTAILKINQGVLTNTSELVMFKNKFFSGFTNEFKKLNQKQIHNAIWKNEALDLGILLKVNNDYILNSLDYNRYFHDNEYRSCINQIYEQVKHTFNIYRVISESPHFFNTLKGLASIDITASKQSFKYRLLSEAENFINNQKGLLPESAFKKTYIKNLNLKDYKKLEKFADDIAITNWLQGLNINFNASTLYQMANQKHSNQLINFKTVEGIKAFKQIMEEFIIPNFLLKSIDYSNNPFVKNLEMYTSRYENYYKLKLNLSKANASLHHTILKEQIKTGFKQLKDIQVPIFNIDGSSIGTWGDLLYIYNVISTKDMFGPNKMTAIFEDYVQQENSLALSLYDSYNKLDKDFNINNYTDFILALLYNSDGYTIIPKDVKPDQMQRVKEQELNESMDALVEQERRSSENQEIGYLAPQVKSFKEIEQELENRMLKENPNSKILKHKYSDFYNLAKDVTDEENNNKNLYLNTLFSYIVNNSIKILLNC